MQPVDDDILMDLFSSPYPEQLSGFYPNTSTPCYWPEEEYHKAPLCLQDSLDEIDPTDFRTMEQEFQDLRNFDNYTLLHLYKVENKADKSFPGESHCVQPVYTDLVSRKRWDSGYSTTSNISTSPHQTELERRYSPCHQQQWLDQCQYSVCSPSSPSNSNKYAESLSPFSDFPSPSITPDSLSGSISVKKTNVKARIRRSKQRQMQLWEFLYYLLTNQHSAALKWENQSEGTFRIVQPGKLADLWGAHRNRTNMTYEKMSRTLRYYYDKELITKVTGKQHTYKFHYNKFP